jgi:hypothetical protein
MRSQNTAPPAANARPDPNTAADFEHLLACWPVNHLNGGTVMIAGWCDWDPADTLARLLRLCDAGLIDGSHWSAEDERFHRVSGRPLTHEGGLARIFWGRPEGAHGMPPVEDPRLERVGIYRCFADHDAQIVRYQGEPEFVVRRRARMRGENLGGYRLQLEGPSPTHPHQRGFAEVPRG